MPLLVSCCGENNGKGQGTGGLAVLWHGDAHVVDEVDSTGLCQANGLVVRVARGAGELWSYQSDGTRCWRWPVHRDGVRNPHDVRYLHDGRLALASTGTNELVWYNAHNQLTRRWKAPGEGDAWHLNCLWQVNRGLYATAFGTFRDDLGWKDKANVAGFLFDVVTGERVLDSLGQPHSPRFFEGRWFVCNSSRSELAVYQPWDSVWRPEKRVLLDGYPRGLDWDGQAVYVGESRLRGKAGVLGTVAVLDQVTLELEGRFEVPFPEVYEVLVVSEGFAEGVLRD